MNVIILGGSGLIGQALAHALLEGNHNVRILSRNARQTGVPSNLSRDSQDRYSVHLWDGRTSNGWSDLVEQSHAIVNLAGESIGSGPWTADRKRRILTSRLKAGQAVVAAIRNSRHKPKLVMQSSAVGYYGPSQDRGINESFPAGKDFLANVAEQWEGSSREVEDLGVRHVVIRTGVVLDLHEGVLPRFLLPFRLFIGGPLGSGQQFISWIHIRDQALAMRFLLENENSKGAYNLTSPEPLTNAEFGQEIAHVMKRPYWLPVPGWALRLFLGDMSTLVLDGQHVLPTRLVTAGYSFEFPRLREALGNLLQESVQ